MTEPVVIVTERGCILEVVLDRLEKYNALNVERLAVSSLVFGEDFKTEVAATRARLAKRNS
jgi:hypothetical protein